jgi:hypothetical protein
MFGRSEKAIVPFAPGSKENAQHDGDPVEQSGHAIVGLIKEAAESSRAICEHATNTAERLVQQLHATEDKIKKLELDVQHYCDRAMRAEKWLARIQHEIEGKFFGPKTSARSG